MCHAVVRTYKFTQFYVRRSTQKCWHWKPRESAFGKNKGLLNQTNQRDYSYPQQLISPAADIKGRKYYGCSAQVLANKADPKRGMRCWVPRGQGTALKAADTNRRRAGVNKMFENNQR